MDVREPFSKLKKKLKHRLTRSKRQPGGAGADSDGERAGPAGSLPQPGPNVVVGGDGENRPQQNEPVSALGSVTAAESENDRAGSDTDGEKVEQPSVPSIPRSGKPDST